METAQKIGMPKTIIVAGINNKYIELMIEQIKNLPENMVGFIAAGKVDENDFVIVKEEVRELVEKTGKLNYLLFLDNSPTDFTVGAWLQDAILGIKNITKWNRAAIVSDSETVIKFTNFFSKIMPGEFRGFHPNELQQAVDWTSEKEEIVQQII